MLQIVSDVNSMRSKRSQVRVCAYLLCDVFFLRFNTRALQRAIWSKFLDRNLFLVASFLFWVAALKFLNLSRAYFCYM